MALIDLIKIVRERTGAGLMDCKAALLANNEDVEKSIDWLREKGIAKVAKKANRIAAEGLSFAIRCPKCGKTVVLEVNCETDFVAKGDAFKNLVTNIGNAILKNNLQTLEEANEACKSAIADATVKMGEKFSLRRFKVFEKLTNNYVYSYIHMGGKIASVVVIDKEDPELGENLAMQIAANNPSFITAKDIPIAEFNHELEIQKEASKNDPKLANKPAQVLEQILRKKVEKYFSEMVLESQTYLLDDTKTVGQVLKEKGVNVKNFVRYQVGEGIEKRKDDFVSEVMAQSK